MSTLTPTPLTVVGAGPAGIMAAYTAAEAGVDVTLVDNNPQPGGQYYRQSPDEFTFSSPEDRLSGRMDGAQVLGRLNHPKIKTIYNTLVWGVFDQHTLALADEQVSSLLPTDRLIVATGAHDRPLAFPGWTLPGIMGAGAALRLIKTQWVLPGRRILLSGLGPLQLALADALLNAGAEVVCVADAAVPWRSWQQLPKFWGHWDRLKEAQTYTSNLRRHHVPLLFNHSIIQASGRESVEKATIARLDRQGRPVPGTEKQYEVDAVCLGYGLLPSFQLPVAMGCQLKLDARLNWFVPEHNERMETTQPGIFVAGDVTDIGGSKVALLEGQLAGMTAAFQLGALDSSTYESHSSPVIKALQRLNSLAQALNTVYTFRPGLIHLATDDTWLCRCEEVTFSQVKTAIADGAVDLNQVKLHTRAGMGYCQGRFCSVLIAQVLAEATKRSLSDFLPFTIRPPFQPIPLKVLATGVDAITPP